jgi:hypothetical protein
VAAGAAAVVGASVVCSTEGDVSVALVDAVGADAAGNPVLMAVLSGSVPGEEKAKVLTRPTAARATNAIPTDAVTHARAGRR